MSPALLMMPADAVFQGRYRVVRAIAAGGMGAVYEVVDETTNARRALKVMLPSVLGDEEMRARFAQEARITGEIESDHIARVFDAGLDEATGTPFIVLELLKGDDLAALLRRRGALPVGEVLTYLGQAARALDKTHAAQIVHRDLKPENLFVTTRDDGSPCLKILDYGIAKLLAGSSQSHATQPIGTPLYMAPEQIRGKGGVGAAVDVYALGHIAYTLLVGEPYWDEEKRGSESLFPLFTAIVEGPQEAPTARARRRRGIELPSGFDGWFARVAAVEPEGRFARATEAMEALAPAMETPTARMIEVVAEVAAEGRADWELGQRRLSGRWLAAGGAALAIAAALLLVRAAREEPVHARARSSATAEPAGVKVVEDALFLLTLEDFEGAHNKLLGIPEGARPTDDPGFSQVEAAWAKWKLELAEKAADPKQKRVHLREVIMTETVGGAERKKAVELLEGLDRK